MRSWQRRDGELASGAAPAGERGGILALTLGALAMAAALIVVVATIAAVYLDRRDLLALADSAAADAATRIDPVAYARGEVLLTDDGVWAAAVAFLDSAPGSVSSGVTVVAPTGAPGPTTAEVTLHSLSRPAFLPWVLAPWSEGIAIEVTASARGG